MPIALKSRPHRHAWFLATTAIAAVHDPELIVIGGSLPSSLVRLMAERATFYEVPVRGLERPFPAVVASEAEGDAVAFGAAALPFMHHFF